MIPGVAPEIAHQEETALSRNIKSSSSKTIKVNTSSRATTTDCHVGLRIRSRRVMLGLSQQQMADLIGVTYQQTHKYERGINRISAGRLYEISQVLKVPVNFFFDGLDDHIDESALPERQRMCLGLARNFSQISNERHQEALSHLARAMAAE